jgi:hypothetical protein
VVIIPTLFAVIQRLAETPVGGVLSKLKPHRPQRSPGAD